MKKAILMTVLLASTAFAAAETPVDFVKKIYREVKATDNEDAVLNKYADSSLKSALRKAARYEMCRDSLVLYPGQDPDYSKAPQFSAAGNRVKVVVTQYGQRSTVYVATNCSGSACKVSDVISEGRSLKKVSNSCR